MLLPVNDLLIDLRDLGEIAQSIRRVNAGLPVMGVGTGSTTAAAAAGAQPPQAQAPLSA